MNASEIFLIVWACSATIVAVYLQITRRFYMVKSAILGATISLIAKGEATISIQNGEVVTTGFEGMIVKGDRVVEIIKD